MFHCYSSPRLTRRSFPRTSSLLSLVRTRSSYSVVLAPGLSSARELLDRKHRRKLLFKYYSMEEDAIEEIRSQGVKFLRRLSTDFPRWRSLPEIDIAPVNSTPISDKKRVITKSTTTNSSGSVPSPILSPRLKTDDVAQKLKKMQDDVVRADLDTEAKSRKRKRTRQEKLLCCMRAGDDE